jgi:hypothetical protein
MRMRVGVMTKRRWSVGPGDSIIVMLDRSSCVTVDPDDSIKTVRLDILALMNASFLVRVPSTVHILHAKKLQKSLQEKLNIDKKWLGCTVVAIPDGAIVRQLIDTDGMVCSWCKMWYPMAESNQPDGSLRCWKCRQNPYARRQIPG